MHTRDTSHVYQSSINVFSLQLCLHFIPLQSHVLFIGIHTTPLFLSLWSLLFSSTVSASLSDTYSLQRVSCLRSEVVLITTSGLNHNNMNSDAVPTHTPNSTTVSISTVAVGSTTLHPIDTIFQTSHPKTNIKIKTTSIKSKHGKISRKIPE